MLMVDLGTAPTVIINDAFSYSENMKMYKNKETTQMSILFLSMCDVSVF